MSDSGVFTKMSNSLYSPVKYGSMVYVETVGTLCIGGMIEHDDHKEILRGDHVFWTQIVTQNSDWPVVSKNDRFLASYNTTKSPIQDRNAFAYLGATTHQNTIYLVGGFSDFNFLGYFKRTI